jgi:hypothetical protein
MVMSLDEARLDLSIEERRTDLIRSAARGQGPTFIAAKLDMLIECVRQHNELLGALKQINALPSELAGDAWAIARAAIAKAEGPHGNAHGETDGRELPLPPHWAVRYAIDRIIEGVVELPDRDQPR